MLPGSKHSNGEALDALAHGHVPIGHDLGPQSLSVRARAASKAAACSLLVGCLMD